MIIYYFLINLLYFCSFLFFGEIITRIFDIDKNLEKISNKYLQYPIISIIFFSFFVSIVIQFGFNIKLLSIILNFVFLIAGIFYILKNRKKFKLINFETLKKNLSILAILISYLLLTFSPITDADSLAYHAYFPKKILNDNDFYFDFYNFHESLIGLVEFFYVIPLYLKSDYTLQLINFFSFLSITAIFLKLSPKNANYLNNFILLILTSPIFFSLVYSAKPQLIFVSISLLSFCLIYKEKKFDNFGLVLFLIILIIFNFLGKSSFLLSSAILFLYLIRKFLKKIFIKDFLKISFFGLILLLPMIITKYLTLETFNINNLINHIPSHLPGYNDFWNYLINGQKVELFPLSIFFPTNFNSISLSFGLWPILLVLFFRKDKTSIFPILLTSLLIIFGLKQNRFYLEPLLWISFIFLSQLRLKSQSKTTIEYLTLIQIIPMFGIIIFTSFYFFIGNFDNYHYKKILKNHAYGYSFNQIVNEKINSEHNIIINTRSLYYGKNNLIYPEFQNYSKSKFYYNEIRKKQPKFIVLIDKDIEDYFLKECRVSLVKTYKVIGKVNRKNLFLNNERKKRKVSFLKIYKFDNPNDLTCLN